MAKHAILVTGARADLWYEMLIEPDGRDWRYRVEEVIDRVQDDIRRVFQAQTYNADEVVLIEGEASGVDTWAKEVARELGWQVEAHPADWDLHGRSAGPVRNGQMRDALLRYKEKGYHVWVHAWHPLGDKIKSINRGSGTADMVRQATRKGFPVEIHQP